MRGAQKASSEMFRTGVVCGGWTLQAQQPQNNIVRIAYQSLAAALGGVQTLATSSFDEAIQLRAGHGDHPRQAVPPRPLDDQGARASAQDVFRPASSEPPDLSLRGGRGGGDAISPRGSR